MYLRVFLIASSFSVCLISWLANVTLYEVGNATVPTFTSAEPTKWAYPQEVIDEIQSMLGYVEALAEHDLLGHDGLFAPFAFDLDATNQTVLQRGRNDWQAFLAGGSRAHTMLSEVPVAWGSLASESANVDLFAVHLAPQTTPTIWLTSFLPGGTLGHRPASSVPGMQDAAPHMKRPATNSSSSGCPAILPNGTVCGKCLNRRAVADAVRYCVRHAKERDGLAVLAPRGTSAVQENLAPTVMRRLHKKTSPPQTHRWTRCKWQDSGGTQCRKRGQARFDGKLYCKNHAVRMQEGKPRARRGASVSQKHLTRTVLRRLNKKTSPLKTHRFQRCRWQEGGGPQCPKRGQAQFDGQLYCKNHATRMQGGTPRLPRAPPLRQVPIGKRFRLWYKQSISMKTKGMCDAAVGCQSRAQVARGDLRFCKFHANRMDGAPLALISLENYTDGDVLPYRLGSMATPCVHCGAFMFEEEGVGQPPHFNICCSRGKVTLGPLQACPSSLMDLLTSTSARAKKFRDEIRAYNSALSFISFGATLELPALTSGRRGPPVCILHGAVYHYSYALEANSSDVAKFAQLYIYDHAEALRRRMDMRTDLDEALLSELAEMLEQCSPFVERYRQMRDLARECETQGREHVTMGFAAATTADSRRYNQPTREEIAVVFVAEDGAPPNNRDMVLWPRDPKTPAYRVDDMNEHVDPCTYALLFPLGDLGWNPHLEHEGPHRTKAYVRVSPMQFYSYRLMIRPGESILPHAGKALFQQYIVDAYVRCEAQRLRYITFHQKELRAETYKGLLDYVDGLDKGGEKESVGKRVILPSSYPGAPRALYQNYLDAMAIVRKFGKPDFFITFTANPSWPEVLAALRDGEQPHDRPDIVARVFHLKLKQLLHELFELHVLGKDTAFAWAIEFQKRGLPHAHILMNVEAAAKVRDGPSVDSRVCAECPSATREDQEGLRKVVLTSMTHGPCGPRNPNAQCMEEGRCTKNYPKEFQPHTVIVEGAYPKYRRRDTGEVSMKGKTEFDNRDVVPYNPYLTRRFGAHINVEVVTSFKSVKYVFKYTFKGHDRAALELHNGDETAAHVDARYVGPAEACWRLFGFPMHGMSHNVERLAVHLPELHSVLFEKGAERETVASAEHKLTTLTAWFALNTRTDDFKDVLYTNIPGVCVWHRATTEWKKRSRGFDKVIGRLCSVSPVEDERYFLYLLLLHVPGAKSFEHLKTGPDNDEPAATFREAAALRGLLDDEAAYAKAMEDARETQMPAGLRRLFGHMLLACGLTTAPALWETFKDDLSDDFRACTKPEAYNRALQAIQDVLATVGKKNTDFDLPAPAGFDYVKFQNRELEAEQHHDRLAEWWKAVYMRAQMYPAQAHAFDAIRAAIDSGEGAVFFVDGPGGSGKSFLFEALVHYTRGVAREIGLSCAWSGLAAALLPSGRTASSRFGLPVPLLEEGSAQYQVTPKGAKGRLLHAMRALFWDEISMTPRIAIDNADDCLQEICQREEPFGGKVVVFGGDMRQVLPVVPRATPAQIKAQAVTSHKYFKDGIVQRFTLATNMRAAKDPDYARFLLEVGDGALPVCEEISPDAIRVPDHLLADRYADAAALANSVFDDVVAAGTRCIAPQPSQEDLTFLSSRAVLAPKNDIVAKFNDVLLEKFPAASVHTYTSSDTIGGGTPEDYRQYPIEFLNSIELSGLPSHKLRVCPGAVVILLRNLDAERGLCNGVRAVVVQCRRHVLDVLVLTGKCAGSRFFLPRIPMSSEVTALPFRLMRRQFPVKLAWAMSINKAQGQSLVRAALILEEPVFAHGQFYVALSRAGEAASMQVCVRDTNTQGYRQTPTNASEGTYTDNVVYRDVLLHHVVLGNQAAQSKQVTAHENEDETLQLARTTADDNETAEPIAAGAHAWMGGRARVDPEMSEHSGDDCDVPLPIAGYTGYFEQQVQARCGLHALNNAIGFQYLDAVLMSQACDSYLEEMAREGVPEDHGIHEKPSGWYSEAVMAFALRMHQHIYKLDLDNPIRAENDASALRIYDPSTIGVVVNEDQEHWTAFKYHEGTLWFLDSQSCAPVAKDIEYYRMYIEQYVNAFAIVSDV